MHKSNVAVLLGLGLLFGAAAYGQRLEATIPLPDSLSGYVGTRCLAYNPVTNLCYVAGEGNHTAVLDGTTGEKRAMVSIGQQVYSACCNPTANKLYFAYIYGVIVLDGDTHQECANIPTSFEPEILGVNPVANKLYLDRGYETSLLVVDGNTDSVIASIEAWPIAFCYAARENKAYVSTWDGELLAVDGAGDTVVARFEPGPDFYAYSLVYNEANNRVYAAAEESVYVIDPVGDSVVKVIADDRHYYLCAAVWNEPSNRVYCLDDDGTLFAIDCSVDSIVDIVELPVWPVEPPYQTPMLSDPLSDKIYCVDYEDGGVVVWNGDTRAWSAVPIGEDASWLAFSPAGRRVFCVRREQNTAFVIDADSDTLLNTVLLGDPPTAMCANRDGTKLYAACSESGDLVVIDAATNRIARRVLPGAQLHALCYDPRRNRFYGASLDLDSLYAIDAATDDVIARILMDTPYALAFNESEDKLYCASRENDVVTVVSGRTNEVLDDIRVGDRPSLLCLSTGSNKLYVGDDDSQGLTVVDCRTGKVIDTLSLGSSPVAMVYDSVDNLIYCATDGRLDSLFAVDCRSDTVVGGLPAHAEPSALCYNPVGNKVYCTGQHGYAVLVIDASTCRIIESLPGQHSQSLWYSRASDHLYCFDSMADSVTVIDGTGDSVTARIAVGDGPHVVVGSDATNRVYVGNYDGSSISVIKDTVPEDLVTSAHSRTLFTRELTLLGAAEAQLIDITGRRVAELRPGQNDLRSLRPGVYFVRRPTDTKSTKLVILR